MEKTYKKINKDMLEVTTIRIQKIRRKDLKDKKQMFKNDIERAKKNIAEIDEKLAIFRE